MYFTLNYDILNSDTQNTLRIHSSIKTLIEQFNLYWTKPLSNMFLIRCYEQRIRDEIQRRLTNIAQMQENRGRLRFLVSPLLSTGPFTGFLQRDFWPHIRNITTEDISDLEELFGDE